MPHSRVTLSTLAPANCLKGGSLKIYPTAKISSRLTICTDCNVPLAALSIASEILHPSASAKAFHLAMAVGVSVALKGCFFSSYSSGWSRRHFLPLWPGLTWLGRRYFFDFAMIPLLVIFRLGLQTKNGQSPYFIVLTSSEISSKMTENPTNNKPSLCP